MSLQAVGIIPARGGSKGLPRKNVRPMCGKPMIAYTIEAALASGRLARTLVTTEDREIGRVSEEYGAEVVDRPRELASDSASSLDVVRHAIDRLEGESCPPDVVVLLQPTSPLRTAADICAALDLSLGSRRAPVISVTEAVHSPCWSFVVRDGRLSPLMGEQYFGLRRQDLPRAYVPNGAIYVAETGDIKNGNGFLGPATMPYVMPGERSVDVDTELDFLLCELLMAGAQARRRAASPPSPSAKTRPRSAIP
jgi:CMP-N-acetylneuraminic acid synthetase